MSLRSRHRWFTHLALLAAVLLSTLPTLGRLQQALHMAGAAARTEALCTVRGLEHVSLPDAVGLSPAEAGQGEVDGDDDGPARHASDDCTYCPLLSGLLLPSLALSGLPWLPTASDRAWPLPASAPFTISIPGLGSRGPPALLAASR